MNELPRVLAALLAFLFFTVPAVDAEEHPTCALSEVLRARLATIRTSGCLPDQPCWSEELAELRDLRERHPESVPVHRDYQQHAEREDRDALLAEYQALLDAASSSAEESTALYLLARVDRERMEQLVERALELDPTHPWASFASMVTQLQKGDERDEELIKQLYGAFRAGCPREQWSALVYVGRFADSAWWTPHLDSIEASLESEPTPARLQALPQLWQARFRLTPLEGHAALRERIGEQLAAIEGDDASEATLLLRVLQQGYELTGDIEGRSRVEAKLAELSPCDREVAMKRVEAFWKARGWTAPAIAPTGARMTPEQARELYSASAVWLEECPDVFYYRSDRFAAARSLPDLDDRQLLAEAEALLASWETAQKMVSMYQSPYFQVARLFLDRKVAVERVPGLLDQEQKLVSENNASQTLPPNLPEDMRRRIEASLVQQQLAIELARVEAHLALTDLDATGRPLDRAEELLAELEEAGDPQTARVGTSERARWGVLRAELALAQGRPSVARSRLRRVERAAIVDDSLREDLDALAAQLGLDLATSPDPAIAESEIADASPWAESEEALGDFDVQDLTGETWRDEDLRGKTTLVNFWATWCAPCGAELPLIEQLHRELADRDDVDVITINIDRDIGLVQPFVTEHELTVPVLLGADVAEDWWNGAVSIPRTWVVDRDAVVRYRQMGFPASEKDRWADDTREVLERVASTNDP